MKTTDPSQPKIIQKRILRTAIVLFFAAALIGGYMWFSRSSHTDSTPADTKGYILAIQNGDQDSHAVLIKPDGTVIKSPESGTGTDDREADWRPDGNRVFISRSVTGSPDPELSNYQIYRWKPDENRIERRTIGTRALAHPRFSSADSSLTDPKALATAGGRVLLFDPLEDSSIKQILPPISKGASMDTSGEGDQASGGDFDLLYKGLGSSFREARWSLDKAYIVAVMRRDNGESLIIQRANPTTDEERRPILILCADHIEFDIHPTKNEIVYSAQNFQWQDSDHVPDLFHKGGKTTRPYNHVLAYLDLDKVIARDKSGLGGIELSNSDGKCWSQPAYSPDGEGLVVVAGAYAVTEGEFKPAGLMFYPAHGGPSGVVAKGQISDPSWQPSGDAVIFARREVNGEKDLVVVPRAGGGEKSLTAGKGNFSRPLYSPQK